MGFCMGVVMAFLSLTALQQAVIRRVRQVAGVGTQLYSEDIISEYIRETYETVRGLQWWDQLMSWETRQLTGTNGRVTAGITGASDGFKDIQYIVYGNNSQPMPQLLANNPNRLTGTTPRYIDPLAAADDATGTFLFRVWPLTATTTADLPLRIRMRRDPVGLFIDPAVIVPFDSAVLINGAAASYAADDGCAPSQVAKLREAFSIRLNMLEKQHNSGSIVLDSRMRNPIGVTDWVESW
jgi:hypothetical protein